MTGVLNPRDRNASCNSRPFNPGICTSVIRHFVSSIVLDLEEMLRRHESDGVVIQGFDKLADAVAGQRVIIDYRNQWNSGHPTLGRAPHNQPKLQFIFKKFDLAQIAPDS